MVEQRSPKPPVGGSSPSCPVEDTTSIERIMIGKVRKFIGEVRVELSKAQWPWDPNEKGFKRYKELADSTMVVLIAMLILGGYIAFFDFILISVVNFLTKS